MIYYILCEFHRVYKNVKRSTVEIPVLPLYVCCVLRQGTLCIFVLVHIDRIGYRLRLEVNQRWPGVPSRGSLWFLSNNTTETRNIKTTFIGRRIKKNCKYVLKDYYPLYRILNAMLKPNTVHCSERFNLTLTPGI